MIDTKKEEKKRKWAGGREEKEDVGKRGLGKDEE